MKSIAIFIQKGGVGKTTTAVSLAAGLVRAGRRVVLIDMDPQANASMWLDGDPDKPGLWAAISGEVRLSQAIQETPSGVKLIAAERDLAGAEAILAREPGGEFWLKNQIRRLPEALRPEYLILDCPPGGGFLSASALTAASELIAPVELSSLGLEGLASLRITLERVQDTTNPALELRGVLPVKLDLRDRISGASLAEIRQAMPEHVLQTTIRTNVTLKEAPSHRQPIFEYAPRSRAAKDYGHLVEEILADG